MQHFNDFFRNADSVHVVSSSSGSGQSYATKYISCIFEAKFFINGAIKSATLLAHAVFASVNSSSRPTADLFPLCFSTRGHEFYSCQNGAGALHDPAVLLLNFVM